MTKYFFGERESLVFPHCGSVMEVSSHTFLTKISWNQRFYYLDKLLKSRFHETIFRWEGISPRNSREIFTVFLIFIKLSPCLSRETSSNKLSLYTPRIIVNLCKALYNCRKPWEALNLKSDFFPLKNWSYDVIWQVTLEPVGSWK